ncbi:MAG: hypothetical protein WKF86_01045 [Acidimicrobiales bacterium]
MRRAAACLLIAGSVIAGCGGEKKEESNGAGPDPKATDKPVEDQLGFETDGILQRQNKVEDLIRTCMKAKGFEYTPVDPAAQRAALTGSATISDEDFEKQFGYGITTLYEQRIKEAASGPNAEYRTSLDPAQRTAYDRTLYGKTVGVTFASAVDTGEFAKLGGCTKEATEQAFGGAQTLSTLQTKLDELDERIVADARMVDANKEWVACMRAAGFTGLKEPDDVDTRLEDKLEEIVGPTPRAGVPTAPKSYDKAALADLQQEEVKLVGADLKCEEKHIEEVEKKVRAEYEKKFQEDNAALLSSIPKA